MTAQSASRFSTTGASFGCRATAAKTDVFHFSAAATHHADCSAEYPTCMIRSTLTLLASAITCATSGESGAVSVMISMCACASTVGAGSGSGKGAR